MKPVCADCGAPAPLSLKVEGDTARLCARCLDRRYPHLLLGSLCRSLRPEAPRAEGPCPHCGTTLDEAKSTGLVGCPLCYEALSPGLWDALSLPNPATEKV